MLAFCADHGMTDETVDDLQEFAAYLGRPEAMFAMSRLENVADDGSNLLKDGVANTALASMLATDTELRVGEMLTERAWDHEARAV